MQIGPATLVVSIPSEWAKKFNIQKGDDIDIEERGRSISITTDKQNSLDSAVLDITNIQPLIFRSIGILYKLGYHKMILKYEEGTKKYRNMVYTEHELIRKALKLDTGVEMSEVKRTKSGNYIIGVERALVEPKEFGNTLNQAFLHLNYLAEETLNAIQKKDKTVMSHIYMMDDMVNQTTNFCLRVLNRKGYDDFKKTPFIYGIVEGVEQIGDLYRFAYIYFKDRKKLKISKECLSLYKEVNSFVSGFYSLYRNFNIKSLVALADKGKELIEKIENSFSRLPKEDLAILSYLNMITLRTYDLFEPLMAFYSEHLISNENPGF
jgi:bifunctional DNA-binding transcriptional regulator/antitoxin component of YhaV-PrlF toxin-antitoxin module